MSTPRDKIDKLLRLAEGAAGTPEADNAQARAEEIAAAHSLELRPAPMEPDEGEGEADVVYRTASDTGNHGDGTCSVCGGSADYPLHTFPDERGLCVSCYLSNPLDGCCCYECRQWIEDHDLLGAV